MVPILGLKSNKTAWESTKQLSEKTPEVVLKLKRCLKCSEENAQGNEKITSWSIGSSLEKAWASATITLPRNAVAAVEGDTVPDVLSASLDFFAQSIRAKVQISTPTTDCAQLETYSPFSISEMLCGVVNASNKSLQKVSVNATFGGSTFGATSAGLELNAQFVHPFANVFAAENVKINAIGGNGDNAKQSELLMCVHAVQVASNNGATCNVTAMGHSKACLLPHHYQHVMQFVDNLVPLKEELTKQLRPALLDMQPVVATALGWAERPTVVDTDIDLILQFKDQLQIDISHKLGEPRSHTVLIQPCLAYESPAAGVEVSTTPFTLIVCSGDFVVTYMQVRNSAQVFEISLSSVHIESCVHDNGETVISHDKSLLDKQMLHAHIVFKNEPGKDRDLHVDLQGARQL